MRPGTESEALRLLHLQSFAGHPQPGQTLPIPVEYTIRPSAIHKYAVFPKGLARC